MKFLLAVPKRKETIAMHFIHCNFSRIHKTLRITLAMAAGIANHAWSLEEIVLMADAYMPKPGKRGAYKTKSTAASDRRLFPRQNRGGGFACFDFVAVPVLVRMCRLKPQKDGRSRFESRHRLGNDPHEKAVPWPRVFFP